MRSARADASAWCPRGLRSTCLDTSNPSSLHLQPPGPRLRRENAAPTYSQHRRKAPGETSGYLAPGKGSSPDLKKIRSCAYHDDPFGCVFFRSFRIFELANLVGACSDLFRVATGGHRAEILSDLWCYNVL